MSQENNVDNPFSALLNASPESNSQNGAQASQQMSVDDNNIGVNKQVINSTPNDAAKVNSLIENVFYITINKDAVVPNKQTDYQLVFLEDLAASEAPKTEIDLDLLEQALFERLLLAEPSLCVVPNKCKSYIEEVIQKNVITYLYAAERKLSSYYDSKHDCERSAVRRMRELILRNAVTALKQPELFEGQDLSDQLLELFKDLNSSSHLFINDLIKDFLSDEEPESMIQLKIVIVPMLASIHKDIIRSSITSLDMYIFPALQIFAGNSNLAQILLEMCTPDPKKLGRGYQETLIGALLSLSALPRNNGAPFEFFQSLDQAGHSALESSMMTALKYLGDNMHRLFLAFLKCGPVCKKLMLEWIAGCLHANAQRGKIWNSRMSGMNPAAVTYVSDGFMINLSSVLLRLCQPFCSTPNDPKSLKIDTTYCAVEEDDREAKGVHMKGAHEETCLLPPREVPEGSSPTPRPTAKTYNFMTECFFMAHKSLDLGYRVAVERLSTLSQDLNRAQRAYSDAINGAGGNVARALQQRIEHDMAKYLTFRCVLSEDEYVSLLASLHATTCNWLVQVAIHSNPNVADCYAPLTSLELKFPITGPVPEILRCVPEFVVENIVGFLSALRRISPGGLEQHGTALLEHALSLVLVYMGSAERMRNPHQRARLAECLEALLPEHPDYETPVSSIESFFREKLFKEHPHRLQIVPCLLDVFVGIEVTGQSVQFEQKFNYRRPMYLVMDYLWKIDEHRECFKRLSDEAEANMEAVTPPIFLRFVNLLMNDAVFLLDEALTNMAQIRTMQAAQDNNEWASLPAQEREQNIANLHHTGMIARFDNILGRDTILALERLTGHVKSVFCHPTMVGRVASMLNYFLLHLVGPNQKNFKVKDSKEYEFDPGATVLNICRIYAHLTDSEEFCLAVSQDGRSYSPQLFKLAEDVLVKIIGGGDLIGSLRVVAERVDLLARRQLEDEEALADAPEEFLDPIMSTLMQDPVILPSSRTTVDRTTIARHLLSDQSDPFNRSPLSMDQVKPNEELKARVREVSCVIRRAASLDAIHQCSTHWPRDFFYLHSGLLQVDKATQTEDSANRGNSGSLTPVANNNFPGEDKVDRFLRHRLQRPPPPHRHASEHASQTMSPVFFNALKTSGSVGVGAPLRAARSSVEGLNQEIEHLVLCPTPSHHLDRHRDKATPEGHRAPLAEMLRRSVNTQTPAHPDSQSHSAHSSGGSVCSSPDLDNNRLGTSPHINRFLAREPPDGCERVRLKFTESSAACSKSMGDISPIKPSVGFQLRPSQGSAFQPLQPPDKNNTD